MEDDFDSAEALCILVQQGGHDCRVALNADEARTITDEFTPDVALVDIGLPGETGYDLLQAMKRDPALANCRFVALTGYSGPDIPQRSIDVGFEAHLTKPVSLELVLAILDECAANLLALPITSVS